MLSWVSMWGMLCRLAAMSVNTGVCQGVNHGLGEILPPALQASLKVGPHSCPSLALPTFRGNCAQSVLQAWVTFWLIVLSSLS